MTWLSPSRYVIVAVLTVVSAALSSAGAQPAWAQTGSVDQPENFGSSDFNQYFPTDPTDPTDPPGPVITGDEFDGPAGSAPNPDNWTYDVGGGGWGNQEKQTYTDSRENSRLDGNGHLVISARRDGNQITSARLTSRGKGEFTNGLLEARIKFPAGDGLSAAFWLLGTKVDSIGWPKCGEIDVVETINEADFHHTGIHGSATIGAPHWEQAKNIYGVDLSADFHTYGVKKEPGRIDILFDNNIVKTFTKSSMPLGASWVFDVPMYAVLNVAAGGVWPGPVTAQTPNPADMIVDWVRVSE
jgi:beta-glucanase (GH16 family)